MIKRITTITFFGCLFLSGSVFPQEIVRYRFAVVVLLEDLEVRADLEDGLAAKFRKHSYDAVTSHDIVPDIIDVSDPGFAGRLASAGIQAVLMMRPTAIGEGSTLESVRNEVSPEIYSDMQAFAREVSSSGADDLLAVIHMAIYLISEGDIILVSAGATWLDEKAEDQKQTIERLQNLIVANVDGARPAIRRHLGLPPLP